MPLLQQGSKRWAGKNVVFVGIDAKDVRGDARKFLARYGVTYRNVYDGKGSTIGRYGVTGYPETYFIDTTGKVRYRIAGPGPGSRRHRRRDRAGARPGVRFLALAVLALALAGPAAASESKPTPAELESELVCPVCETTLDTSDAPAARRIKAYIRVRIAAGDTKSEIKAKLVDQFGPTVLAVPPRKGFDWLAWLLPLGGTRRRGRPRRCARLALEPPPR